MCEDGGSIGGGNLPAIRGDVANGRAPRLCEVVHDLAGVAFEDTVGADSLRQRGEVRRVVQVA